MILQKSAVDSVIFFVVIIFNFSKTIQAGVTPSTRHQNDTSRNDCRFDSNTKTLDCSNLNLNVIPKNNIPNSILMFNLSLNNIENIDDDSFAELQDLTVLDLSNNKIKTVNQKTFRGLKSLETLYINSNQLTELEPNTFSDLRNLTRLSLSENQMLEIREPFLEQKSLIELNLDYCNIEDIPERAFINLSQLENLTLAGNPFNEELSTSAFEPLQKLIKLRMPNTKANVISSLCEYLISIDVIMFDEFNVSCLLLDENRYSVEDAIVANDPPEKPLIRSVTAPTSTSTTKTLATSSSTTKPLVSVADQTLNTSTQRVNITTSDSETSTNQTKTEPDTAQIDIDKETINLMLLVILGVTITGLIIGLICRIDICGIKTKLCRSNKSKTNKTNNRREPADTVSPFEEIPLNTMSKSAEAEGQG